MYKNQQHQLINCTFQAAIFFIYQQIKFYLPWKKNPECLQNHPRNCFESAPREFLSAKGDCDTANRQNRHQRILWRADTKQHPEPGISSGSLLFPCSAHIQVKFFEATNANMTYAVSCKSRWYNTPRLKIVVLQDQYYTPFFPHPRSSTLPEFLHDHAGVQIQTDLNSKLLKFSGTQAFPCLARFGRQPSVIQFLPVREG